MQKKWYYIQKDFIKIINKNTSLMKSSNPYICNDIM
jgi:hypothetical protein